MKQLLIVAGEASGDAHAADLVREAKRLCPDLHVFGLGGPKMKQAGVEILFDPMQHSSTGITEIFASIPRLFPYLSILENKARNEAPEAAILVDYPEFNLRLAKRLKRAGTRVIYYISPQFWAWREWRVKSVQRYVDHMLVLFDFEVAFYRKHGVEARFVGHPLVEKLAGIQPDPGFRASLGIPEGNRVIGLLPGSRRKEVRHIYPPMAGAAQLLHQHDRNLSFVLGKAPAISEGDLRVPDASVPIEIANGRALEVMANADLLLVASGTATLEAAIIGTPMIVGYKATPITYHLCKPLKKSKYLALVNILADREVVPEFLQYQLTPERLATTAASLMKDGRLETVSQELQQACSMLGPPGASRRAAQEVLKILGEASDNN